jgi:ribose-phosphate pyrophosphokinase
MRQDKRFKPGEAITSVLFAKLLADCIDYIITIDPHLHRIASLAEIFTIPAVSLHATSKIAAWISEHVNAPFLIGPDEESRQWVEEIAGYANLPFVIGQKKRLGDKDVVISLPAIKNTGYTPILVDDIISTGVSMITILNEIKLRGFKNPLCIAVHALFNDETENQLLRAGAKQVMTCNTILHPTNCIDLTDIIMQGISDINL